MELSICWTNHSSATGPGSNEWLTLSQLWRSGDRRYSEWLSHYWWHQSKVTAFAGEGCTGWKHCHNLVKKINDIEVRSNYFFVPVDLLFLLLDKRVKYDWSVDVNVSMSAFSVDNELWVSVEVFEELMSVSMLFTWLVTWVMAFWTPSLFSKTQVLHF